MEKLPLKLISQILSFLDFHYQLQVASVSRLWRAAAEMCLGQRRELTWFPDKPGLAACTDTKLRALLPRLPALRDLCVRADFGLDIDTVSENCRLLEELDLTSFPLNVPAVKRLCRRCPRLMSLQLPRYCSAACLAPILRLLPGLRRLYVQDSTVPAGCVTLLPASLEELELFCCRLPKLPVQPAGRWPVLDNLMLGGSEPGRSMAALVAGCPGLERLVADQSDASDHLLRRLPDLHQLQHLDIASCDRLTEAGLMGCMGRLRRLEKLYLPLNVTDAVLDRLAGAEVLSKLKLGYGFHDEFIQCSTDALQRLVLACASMKSLRLYSNLWDIESLEALITGLAQQLNPERNVTLSVRASVLEALDRSILPSSEQPLLVTTYQMKAAERSTDEVTD